MVLSKRALVLLGRAESSHLRGFGLCRRICSLSFEAANLESSPRSQGYVAETERDVCAIKHDQRYWQLSKSFRFYDRVVNNFSEAQVDSICERQVQVALRDCWPLVSRVLSRAYRARWSATCPSVVSVLSSVYDAVRLHDARIPKTNRDDSLNEPGPQDTRCGDR